MTRRRHPNPRKAAQDPANRRLIFAVAVGAAALGALVWAYWPVLRQLIREWNHDENYSVGMLVPFAAVYLVWHERERLKRCDFRPCWWGLGIILVAQAGRFFGLLFLFESAERYAMVLTLVGCVLLLCGWQVFRRLGWVMAFLFLMVPFPGRVHNLISGPLQTHATTGAVFALEVAGETVARAGNVMNVNGTEVAVAEACSGLRMLTAFIVVSAFMAYMVKRPRWQKAVLLASSVPIAIFSNIFRLFVTAEAFAHVSQSAGEAFHDAAGLAMMPPAVVLLVGELWIMKRLVIPEPHDEKQSARPARAAGTSAEKASRKTRAEQEPARARA
jgi:exosortase